MRVLRASDYKVMPWKNGGGETTEIAVSPDGAGLADFDWRVSMAKVAGDGPFSTFPGIDRTLAILESAGIVLSVEGAEPKPLTLETAPHAFPADAATSAALIGGAVLDFNVMSRRGKIDHRVERLANEKVSPAGSTRLLLCSRGTLDITVEAKTERLGKRDAALLDETENALLTPGPDSQFYLVEFRAA
ncbi:HutD family protein [Rhizobium sp. TH2]|uniref:HutD/Ves family protein n=1 Tax=Rhizobium sp. TH2 TaxID=2775403 RepID=UPI0021580E8E|nr:HutD family protein [Rhizobium sp. TH2]UVC06936.1 HutD family protein [Rhizobium sp. TH2]